MSEIFDELIAELEASDKPDRRLAAELLAMRADLARLQAVEQAAREYVAAKPPYDQHEYKALVKALKDYKKGGVSHVTGKQQDHQSNDGSVPL